MCVDDLVCQLCSVGFNVSRIRRRDEPPEAAWTDTAIGYVDTESKGTSSLTCRKGSGCITVRHGPWSPPQIPWKEHVAGPGCASGLGYSGHRITVEEMRDVRKTQCLLEKGVDWEPEADDQDFELESNYFLTGIGKTRRVDPIVGRIYPIVENIRPVRHGVLALSTSNAPDALVCIPLFPPPFFFFSP